MIVFSSHGFPRTEMFERIRVISSAARSQPRVTCSNLRFWRAKHVIRSPISMSWIVEVLTGFWYSLIIAQTIIRYCSRFGNEEFWITLLKNLNCFIRAFTVSTTHRTLVTFLDWFASDEGNCRRPLRKGGKATFNPRSSIDSIAITESPIHYDNIVLRRKNDRWTNQTDGFTFSNQSRISSVLWRKMFFMIDASLLEKSDKNGPIHAMM